MLSNIRVVDLSTDVAGGYAARLLATYGADIVKVEAPEGDPTRWLLPRAGDNDDPDAGILFAYLNAGKRSVVLDIDNDAQREQLLSLLRTVDLVIESSAPGTLAARGIDLDALIEERPSLVVCSITPFGQDGPRSDWRATALTAYAAGGQMMITGEPDQPPLKAAGHQAQYQAGLHGFSASLTALYAAETTGTGDHIDISSQEVQVSALEWHGPAAMTRGGDQTRAGNLGRAIWSIYPCADGYVGVAAMARQAPSVYECIGHAELNDDPAFTAQMIDPDTNAVAVALITEWTMAHTSKEIYAQSAEVRAPFSMIPTPRELLEWPPLVEAGFWQQVDHPTIGAHQLPSGPVDIDGSRGEQHRAPLLGEHTAEVLASLDEPAPAPTASDAAPPLPFGGLRVLDLTQIWAGPFAARFAADMGADVIHIEGPAFPDGVRGITADLEDPLRYNKSAYFNEYNRNKRGMALDLRHPDGLAAFLRMVEQADVLIENWSSGVAERIGLGFEALKAINPLLVVVSMPGFGHHGEEAGRVGFGPTIEQMGGLVSLQGYPGEGPQKSGISYGDPVAGIAAAGAIALGLLKRERTGEGSYSVVPQRDNVIGLIGEYVVGESAGHPLPVRTGSRDPHFAPHNVYRTRDSEGRPQLGPRGDAIGAITETWLAIAIDSDAAWQALRSTVADARLDDPAYATVEGRRAAENAIDTVIGEWAADRNPADAASELQAAGVSASPVLSPYMLVRDEHLATRSFFPTYDHADAGVLPTTRPVWRLARRPFASVRPAPRFGEHNREVLSELAGLDSAAIDALAAAGVIVDAPVYS
jgi:crotonobetainyl-CoA:carnitine CoA-transferase CaiB-like acyl-CoA transferase